MAKRARLWSAPTPTYRHDIEDRSMRRDIEVLRTEGAASPVQRWGREMRYSVHDDGPRTVVNERTAHALALATGILDQLFAGTPVRESLELRRRRLEASVPRARYERLAALAREVDV